LLRGEETIMLARPRVRVASEDKPGRGHKKRGKRGAVAPLWAAGSGIGGDAGGVELSGDDLVVAEGLFEALRALRREIADREGVPPYVVFHDATLREMAVARPATEEAMLDIGGVGERKLEKYGAEFLALINP
jgi:ATP-dependent DNA helicase RecQ